MTEKELRRLSRADLLELLVAQSKENQALQDQLRQAREALQQRTIELEQAGSIAEAALRLNGVFEDAQKAADQYLENIRAMEQTARQRCQAMERETYNHCKRLLEQARSPAPPGEDTQ